MKRKNFPGRKKQRQDKAQKRKEQREMRDNKGQLTILDERLGKDKGAVKERIRLSQND